MTTAMTTQAIVNDLAARRKPCSSRLYPERPESQQHTEFCHCGGTGAVPAFPWLTEECSGHWTHKETGEHIGPTMAYLQPWHDLKENRTKAASYLQRHGAWCCDGFGQRVRQAETVHLEEVLVAASTLRIGRDLIVAWDFYLTPNGDWQASFPTWTTEDDYKMNVALGATPVKAALRALRAAVTEVRK